MVEVSIQTTEWQEVLIALLGELGYEGFQQEEEILRAYVREEQFDRAALEVVLRQFEVGYTDQRLAERNWDEEWEKNFEPVVVDDFCAIRAHFHKPITGVEHALLITPKMSFGTGHHATTFMMIRAMGELDFQGKRVLDFGTGTGVLAILAERLGAGSVLAIDNRGRGVAAVAIVDHNLVGHAALRQHGVEQRGDVVGLVAHGADERDGMCVHVIHGGRARAVPQSRPAPARWSMLPALDAGGNQSAVAAVRFRGSAFQ